MSTSGSPPERERLDVDLLFVGAGAATLAAVIRLADLCESRGIELPEIMVLSVSRAKEKKDIIAAKYLPVKSYDLHVAPEFRRAHPKRVTTATVYKRKIRTGGNHKNSVP